MNRVAFCIFVLVAYCNCLHFQFVELIETDHVKSFYKLNQLLDFTLEPHVYPSSAGRHGGIQRSCSKSKYIRPNCYHRRFECILIQHLNCIGYCIAITSDEMDCVVRYRGLPDTEDYIRFEGISKTYHDLTLRSYLLLLTFSYSNYYTRCWQIQR